MIIKKALEKNKSSCPSLIPLVLPSEFHLSHFDRGTFTPNSFRGHVRRFSQIHFPAKASTHTTDVSAQPLLQED